MALQNVWKDNIRLFTKCRDPSVLLIFSLQLQQPVRSGQRAQQALTPLRSRRFREVRQVQRARRLQRQDLPGRTSLRPSADGLRLTERFGT